MLVETENPADEAFMSLWDPGVTKFGFGVAYGAKRAARRFLNRYRKI